MGAGEVEIVTEVSNPDNVSKVVFTVTKDGEYTATEIGTAYKATESALYTLKWDTTTVANGQYRLEAEVYDGNGDMVANDYIRITISNNQQSGLVLNIKKPDGTPAAGAQVMIRHPNYSQDSEGQNVYFEYVYDGTADLQGRVIIPATEATDGNDYLITAYGSEPNYFYYKNVRAPGNVTMDASDAKTLQIEGKAIDGTPLGGAVLVGDLLEANLPQSPDSKDFIDEAYSMVLSTLSSSGTGKITLTKGIYDLRLISNEKKYFLNKPGLVVNDALNRLDFAPGPSEVATLRITPEEKYANADFLFRAADYLLYGFEKVDNNTAVTVYPGNYEGVIEAIYRSPETSLEWKYKLETSLQNVAAGETRLVRFGNIQRADFHLPDWYGNSFDTYGHFTARFLDSFDNMATYIGKQPYTPTVAATGDFQSRIIMAREEKEPQEDSKQKQKGLVQSQRFALDKQTAQFKVISQAFTEVKPTLNIYQTENGVDKPPVNNTNNSGCYYPSWPPFGLWVAYWFIPEQTTGDYKAKVSWQTGHFGPENGSVTTEPVEFSVQQSSYETDGLTVAVKDRTGANASVANVALVQIRNGIYSLVDYDSTSNGTAYLDYYDLDETEKSALIVTGASGNDDMADFLIFKPLTQAEMDSTVLVDASQHNLHKITLKPPVVENSGGDDDEFEGWKAADWYSNDNWNYSVGGFDADSIPYSISVGEANSPVGKALWLAEGDYLLQAEMNHNFAQYYSLPMSSITPLYFINEQVNIPTQIPDDGIVSLGNRGLTSLTVECPQGADGEEQRIAGVALFWEDMQNTPILYPYPGQSILVSPGSYRTQAVMVREHYRGDWGYWLTNELEVGNNPVNWVVYGVPDRAEIDFEAPTYAAGDQLKSTHVISDAAGNRLVTMALNMPLYGGIVPSSILTAGAEEKSSIGGQNHTEIAPFFSVKDSSGKEIYRYKDPGEYSYDLEPWRSGGLTRYPVNCGTFTGAEFTIPVQNADPQYTAVLELGAGPDGMIKVEKEFFTASLRLNQPVSPTKANSVSITGVSQPNKNISLRYNHNNQTVQAGTALSDANGLFAISVTLPDEGLYEFIAFCEVEEGTAESLPVTLTVDRTAPAAPGNLTGEGQDQTHIKIAWEPSASGDIDHYVVRRGIVGTTIEQIATIPANASALEFLDSGLAPNIQYEYQVAAVDKAGNVSVPATCVASTSTIGDTSPPTTPANVTVTAMEGGMAEVRWQAALDNVGVAGYKIMRALGDGPMTQVAATEANRLVFKDTGLAAETTYYYSVTAFDAAGNQSIASLPVKVDTKKLFITSITWRTPRVSPGGPALKTGMLTFSVTGEPYRQAVANMVYKVWDGSTEGQQTTTVNLTEELLNPGLYKGSLPMPAGITQLTSVSGRITDGFEHYATKDAVGLPLAIAGSLEVNVNLGTDLVPDDTINGWRLAAWSESKKSGASVTVSGPGKYSLDLIPGNDYVIHMYSQTGHEVAKQSGLEVMSGRDSSVSLTPVLPAELKLKVVEQGTDKAVGGVKVVLRKPNGDYINYGVSDGATGFVTGATNPKWDSVPGLYSGEPIVASAYLEKENLQIRYEVPEEASLTLQPGANLMKIELPPKSMGRLQGTVADERGNPLGGAQVTVVQALNGKPVNFTTQTDAEGSYALELMPGQARVTFAHRLTAAKNETVTVEPDTTTTLDTTLTRRATVIVDVYTKRTGQPEYLLDLDWRVAVHFGFRIRNLTKNCTVNWSNANWPGVPVDGADPGDEIEITVDGREAGLNSQTIRVVLDENKMAKAEFHIKDLGRVEATVRDVQGNLLRGVPRYVDIFHSEGQKRKVYGKEFSTEDIKTPGLQAGSYIAVFTFKNISRGYFDGYTWVDFTKDYDTWRGWLGAEQISIPFEVKDAEITDLGAVSVPYAQYGSAYSYFSGRPGNNFSANLQDAVPGSVVTLRAGFKYHHGVNIRDPKGLSMTMTVPDAGTLIPDSIVFNMVYGQTPSVSYPNPGLINLNFGDAAAQPGGIEGSVSYQVRLTDKPNWPTTGARAWMNYTADLGIAKEDIGQAIINIPYLSISAPGFAPSRELGLSGRGPAGVAVSVYDNGFFLGEAVTSNYGTWKMEVVLPDIGRRAYHFLKAEAQYEGMAVSSKPVAVLNDPDQPFVNNVKMYQQDGRQVTFNPEKGVASFPYVYVPGTPFVFEVGFNDNTRVKDVTVHIDNGGALTGSYDAQKQAYVAQGAINYSNWWSSSLPGSIHLSYETKPQPYTVSATPPANLQSMMPDAWRDAVVTVNGASSTAIKATNSTVTFPPVSVALGGSQKKINMTFSVTPLTNYVPNGSQAFKVGEGGPTVYNYQANVWENSNGRAQFEVSLVVPMSAITSPLGGQYFKGQSEGHALVKVLGESPVDGGLGVADLYDTIKSGFEFKEKMDKLGALLDAASNCSSSSQQYYRAMADHMAQKAMTNLCIKYSLQLGGMALAATGVGTVGTVIVWGVSGVLTEVGDARWDKTYDDLMKEMAGDKECKDEDEDDDDGDDKDDKDEDKDKRKKKKVSDPKWILDPSGYVYEAVADNRLENVKTTILEKNPENGQMMVWDATWYEQVNPLFTDIYGRYAWDVPEGDWQVVYQKEHYEPTSSEVMHVPPPRLDVNVGMVSLLPPAVNNVTASPGGAYLDISFDKYMRVNTVSNSTITVFVYGDEDSMVQGIITPINPVPLSTDESVMVAQRFRFTPEESNPLTVNGAYSVLVDEMVLSYADRPMAQEYEAKVVIPAQQGNDDDDPGNDPGDDDNGNNISGGGGAPVTLGEQNFTIGPEAKTLTALNGELSIVIPAGAFTGEVKLTVKKLGSPQVGKTGLTPVSPIYEFDTGGIVPKKPLKIAIRFNKALADKVDLRKLGVYKQDDKALSRWEHIGGLLDPATDTEWATLKAMGAYAVMAYNQSFSDLKSHWSQKDVEVLASRHLVKGVNEKQFQPERRITRAEMATLLVQMLAADPDRDTSFTPLLTGFSDVSEKDWYFSSVERAARYGLVKGSNGRFRPNDAVTREEMAIMLVNAMGLAEQTSDGKQNDKVVRPGYADAGAISDWAVTAVRQATAKGIMRGLSNNTFKPNGNATRAEAAVVILRSMERLGLIKVFATTSGVINISTKEAGYFEVQCSSGAVKHLLLPAGEDIGEQLKALVGQDIEVTGIFVANSLEGVKTPTLEVVSVGGKPSKPSG